MSAKDYGKTVEWAQDMLDEHGLRLCGFVVSYGIYDALCLAEKRGLGPIKVTGEPGMHRGLTLFDLPIWKSADFKGQAVVLRDGPP